MHNFIPLSDTAPTRPADSDHVVAIKRWTREVLRLDSAATAEAAESFVVSVNEFACADAGCPLLETVIAVFGPANVRTWRFTRPRFAVTKLMLQQTLSTPPALSTSPAAPPAR